MRILVISRAPWIEDNGIGSTLTDFFSGFSQDDIYSLCMREAPYVSEISKKNFYISESQIINNILKKKAIGFVTEKGKKSINELEQDSLVYHKGKNLNLVILKFLRELIWSLGKWKNERLEAFLEEISPDIIFFPDFPCIYAHKILKYIWQKTNAKVAIFHADDCYTLKQFSLSPLYWIYRFWQRKWVRSSVKIADLHYVISDVQKIDYDRAFKVNNKILTKFGDFSVEPALKKEFNRPLEFVYTGNIELNRWKSLAKIAETLKKINQKSITAQLKIYTGNHVTNKMRSALNIENCSFIMGKVPAEQIEEIQKNADILVHVESTDLKNRCLVRQSFSTKIVDYLKRGRMIVAVGPKDVASIKHLSDNKCAVVANSSEELYDKLMAVISSPSKMNYLAERAYECGRKYHNKADMLKMLYNDFHSQ